MEDRRVQKSRDAIRRSFLGLLAEKGLGKVTVAEICRRANVGRGTFYLHYLDVYDLYDKIEAELFAGLLQLFGDAFPSTDAENGRRLAEGLTSYIERHGEAFLLLARAEGGRSLQRLKARFTESVVTETRRLNPEGGRGYDEVEAVFVVCGMVGVLEQWLAEGMTIPRADLAAMLGRILCKVNASDSPRAEGRTGPVVSAKGLGTLSLGV